MEKRLCEFQCVSRTASPPYMRTCNAEGRNFLDFQFISGSRVAGNYVKVGFHPVRQKIGMQRRDCASFNVLVALCHLHTCIHVGRKWGISWIFSLYRAQG